MEDSEWVVVELEVSMNNMLREKCNAMQCNIVFFALIILPQTIDLYSIPIDEYGDDPNDSGEPKFLKPFDKSCTISGVSGFAALGNFDLYCSGGLGGETTNCDTISDETFIIKRFDTTCPNEGWKNVNKMLSPRMSPNTEGMDEKLYIFGGLARPNDIWAECFDPCSNSSLPLPLPLLPSPPPNEPLVTAALHYLKKILVGFCFSNSSYLFDVKNQDWEKLDHKVHFSAVRGEAAVVRNTTMCWFDETFHVLHAYDLVLKMWFREPIKGLDKVGMLFSGVSETECSLLTLDDNHLCLLWIDHRGYSNTYNPLLHCTKVRVYIEDGANGTPRIDVFVVSSRSYVLETTTILLDALVLENQPLSANTEA